MLDCLYSPLTKITYILTFPLPLWNSFSDLSEVLTPRIQSSFCPQIKLPQSSPTGNSHFVYHFSQHSQETQYWGKEHDFIWKAGWPRRWQTNVSKQPFCRVVDARFFYRTVRRKNWGSKDHYLANISWNGHLQHSFIPSWCAPMTLSLQMLKVWEKK